MYTEILSPMYHMAHNISHITSENYLIHSHPFYELYYFVSGDASILYNGAEYVMKPHTFIIFVPDCFHGIHVRSSRPYERYTAHFTPELFTMTRAEQILPRLPTLDTLREQEGRQPCVIEHADTTGIYELFQSYEQFLPLSQRTRDALTGAITEAILIRYLLTAPDASPLSTKVPVPRGQLELSPILTYIQQHLSEPLSLDSLSSRFHLSKGKLNSLFHRQMNCSPMEYVTVRRIHYAQQLLLNGVPASRAFPLVGFDDYTGFYRAYRKVLGHPPSTDTRTAGSQYVQPLDLWKQASGVADISIRDQSHDEQTIWTQNLATQATAVDIATLRDP